ncbi:hypothetical protein [Bacteriovorax sp. BSW11_IV]|uniref:hypothetical protein n=1 Tax=Bacteriovorax sp. BSW11_IV TaxID=1353529 RepID=UPI0012DC2813|nr:hypothetical protein [Bacteriovorax sp. BSW11_IV]
MRKLINFKTLPLLFTLLLSTNAFAAGLNLKVDDYRPTDFEYMFEIQNSKFSKVILDCQSFINEVRFYQDSSTVLGSFMLDIQECEDIHFSIVELKEKGKTSCLRLDFDNQTYDVDEADKSCE